MQWAKSSRIKDTRVMDKRDRTLSPPVVMMYESDGGDQLMILSPPTSRN